MEKFNYEKSPLNGINLIEASAGTGKTYTLSVLFVRLILEKNLTVDQILVVTFTRAATEELKERIRKRIYDTHKLLKEENFDSPELKFIKDDFFSRKDTAKKLKKALEDFDRASIFTIHGFCQKILFENAFEAGSLFNTELVSDASVIMLSIAEDFWRKYFYGAPAELVVYANHCKINGPDYFLKLFQKKRCPDIKIVPQPEQPDIENPLSDYKKNLNELRHEWKASKKTVLYLLKSAPLNGRQYGTLKPDKNNPEFTVREIRLLRFSEGMEHFLSGRKLLFPLFDDFKYFTASLINEKVNKNGIPPSHHFFESCDQFQNRVARLQEVLGDYLLFLKAEFFRFAGTESGRRKRDENIKFFDDLLVQVRNALNGTEGKALAASVRNIYKAALIDEFQDTDFIQYEIFSKLYSSSDAPLFLIGDPKQAIYSFRGADVFSYIQASKNSENKYTLDRNWRSTPSMIDAVNTLFSGHQIPFVLADIPFHSVLPGGENTGKRDTFQIPLTLWFSGAGRKSAMPVSEATEIISGAVADEILNIVNCKTAEIFTNIEPGEIAVLVRTNRQAGIIKKALSDKNIPAVLFCDDDVFHSREALEIERILSGIAEPLNERKFRAAVVSDLIGVPGEELAISELPSALLEKIRAEFHEYHQLWLNNGFIRMFRHFLAQSSVRSRLLGFSDGERRLTNVLHLAELIHQCEFEKRLSVSGVLKWISDKRNTGTTVAETHQLRLESDARAVKILTMHKSKGLEFPVVFCPFCWSDALIEDDIVCYHDTDNRGLILDIGSDAAESALVRARNELLAENMRLLYVALTRAKLKCYLAWGWIKNMESSSPAYLFHHHVDKVSWETEDIVRNLADTVSKKSGDELFAELQVFVEGAENISLKMLKETGVSGEQYQPEHKVSIGQCRKFNGKIPSAFRIASYSSLAFGGRLSDHVVSDYDHISNKFEKQFKKDIRMDIDSIFSFPKGARAGIFFHDLFEHLDFTINESDTFKALINEKLNLHGFDLKWQNVVYEMVRKVISTPLDDRDKHFALSEISLENRINEMEFYFPLKRIKPSTLKNIFGNHYSAIPEIFSEQLGQLTFSPAEGFLKGFIDLIFRKNDKYYLLDWKSNFLGDNAGSYNRASLNHVMLEDNYILQYCLYSLALHQFLKLRIINYDYNTHFGGVFYLFIRGMGHEPETGNGIYFDLPDLKLINAMEKAMIR
ncbi:MAG: exodeoxyribonuclease V subunit beta [Desulfobacterales bacterium]|nr:exodeoxyribonuclease V subunit beta [Desulfobacterales bacterium]